MTYTKELKKALDEAKPLGGGYSHDELCRRISEITERLKRPVGNTERILLCADRAALRKTLLEGER